MALHGGLYNTLPSCISPTPFLSLCHLSHACGGNVGVVISVFRLNDLLCITRRRSRIVPPRQLHYSARSSPSTPPVPILGVGGCPYPTPTPRQISCLSTQSQQTVGCCPDYLWQCTLMLAVYGTGSFDLSGIASRAKVKWSPQPRGPN